MERGLRPMILDDSVPFTAEDFFDKLFPNVWSLLINLIALVVLFVLLFFIAYKPVRKYVEARKNHIENEMRESERLRRENEATNAQKEEIIKGAQDEASAIIAKAKGDAKDSAIQIRQDAEKAAAKKLKDADEAIALAEKRSREEMREEMVNIALDASKQLLGREVNAKDDERLLASFVDDLNKKD